MLSFRDDLFFPSAFAGTVAILFVWKRHFLINFLIRREEHQARQSNNRQTRGIRGNFSSSSSSSSSFSSPSRQHHGNATTSSQALTSSILLNENYNTRNSSADLVENTNFHFTKQPSRNKNVLSTSPNHPTPLTVGANDGSVFGIAERIPPLFGSISAASTPPTTATVTRFSSSSSSSTSLSNQFFKYNFLLPGSSAFFLLKGFDVSESFAPAVPHRHTTPRGGPLGALLYPLLHHSSSSSMSTGTEGNSTLPPFSRFEGDLVVDAVALQQQQANAAVFATVGAGNEAMYFDERFLHHQNQHQHHRIVNSYSSSSSSSSSSSWVEALLVASANVTSRGGERCSDDIERAIESLLFAKRRRQAFDTFDRDKDVPLKAEVYDQLLRTFLSDREHIFAILTAMEMHGIYQSVLKSGERSSLAQAIFEALSIHDYERAMSAFSLHHGNYLKKTVGSRGNSNAGAKEPSPSHSPSSPASASASASSIPVYSGLLSALIRRGMRKEAQSIIVALNTRGASWANAESKKDIATGLIRCLHHEFENTASSPLSSSSSSSSLTSASPRRDAIEFTQGWLLSEEKKNATMMKQREANLSSRLADEQSSSNQLQKALERSKIGLHAKVACSVFAQHPNAFTCTALSKFLLQHHPTGSTPVLQAAISLSLFPSATTASILTTSTTSKHCSHNHNRLQQQQQQYQHQQVGGTIVPPTNRGVAAVCSSSSSSPTSLHLARLAVSRAINRRGNWQLAISMAQHCLKAKTFEPVGALAATVARNGKWSAALRLGTQLFALRRAPPTTHELSLCVHSSLWSGRWSSALFWVERAHSRGLKFEPSVYDAAFAAASAAALASGDVGRLGDRETGFSSKAHNGGLSPSKITRHNFDAAIRTVQCMAEMGGQCSGESIEELIATAAKMEPVSHGRQLTVMSSASNEQDKNSSPSGVFVRDDKDGAPKIIDVLCDSGIVDWKL